MCSQDSLTDTDAGTSRSDAKEPAADAVDRPTVAVVCPGCRYDVAGLDDKPCPECGEMSSRGDRELAARRALFPTLGIFKAIGAYVLALGATLFLSPLTLIFACFTIAFVVFSAAANKPGSRYHFYEAMRGLWRIPIATLFGAAVAWPVSYLPPIERWWLHPASGFALIFVVSGAIAGGFWMALGRTWFAGWNARVAKVGAIRPRASSWCEIFAVLLMFLHALVGFGAWLVLALSS